MLEVHVMKLDPDLPLPAYARPGDAGLDLLAREDALLAPGGGRALVATGIAVAIPEGHAGFIQPRSGLALKHGVTCLNTPGLIDSGYRGELKVLLVNTDPTEAFQVTRGERIAQLVIQKVAHAVLSFGGFIGIGEDYYPVPWSMLKYDTNLGGYRVKLTKDQLDKAPKYSKTTEWNWDLNNDRRVYDYYKVSPYWDM